MSSWAEYVDAGCLPVGHTAAHPRLRQVSQGTWCRRRQGWELEWVSEGDADYLAIAPELQPNRVDVQSKRVGKRDTGRGGNRPSALRTGYRLAAWATPSVGRVQGSTGGGVCAGGHL
jgi:hypothetical protein